MVGRLQGQKPNLRGGGDGGGSKPWSSSTPDFSTTTWVRSPAGRARGTFGCGEGAGVATAAARGGGGELSGDPLPSSARGVGVFAGFGVSSSRGAGLVVFLFLRPVCFSRDFFFADFGLGVGVWCRFDFGEVVGSGVSRGVGSGVFSASVGFSDSLPTSFARGMALGAFSGVADGRCFFVDLLVAFLAAGLGDFFGFGDDSALVSLCSDSPRRLFFSSLTCAQRRPATIAPMASAAQMRKRTTATESNRARGAINHNEWSKS